MKKITLFILCVITFAMTACNGNESSPTFVSDEKPIRIGFMICDSYELSKARFAPFTAYLSEKTGRKFEMVLANTFEFEDLMENDKIDFFHINSIVALILKERFKADLLEGNINDEKTTFANTWKGESSDKL